MITTNQEELYKKLLLFRTHGITRDEDIMTDNEGDWYYQQLDLGYNYRITDIQCALGISQMNRLDEFVAKRRTLAERYNQAFQNVSDIMIPEQEEGCHNSYHLYVIQIVKKIGKKYLIS